MLLSFEVNGYKLFDDSVNFSMHALKKFKRLQENVYTQKIGNKEYNVLKSAIIYGPNNSGKTTFIKAIAALKHIVEEECIDDITKDNLNFNFFDSKIFSNTLIIIGGLTQIIFIKTPLKSLYCKK